MIEDPPRFECRLLRLANWTAVPNVVLDSIRDALAAVGRPSLYSFPEANRTGLQRAAMLKYVSKRFRTKLEYLPRLGCSVPPLTGPFHFLPNQKHFQAAVTSYCDTTLLLSDGIVTACCPTAEATGTASNSVMAALIRCP